jgi:hypothetical protein
MACQFMPGQKLTVRSSPFTLTDSRGPDHRFVFQDSLLLEEEWRVSLLHYRRTLGVGSKGSPRRGDEPSRPWSHNCSPLTAARQVQRWRLFLMACSELLGYSKGTEWWVSHHPSGGVLEHEEPRSYEIGGPERVLSGGIMREQPFHGVVTTTASAGPRPSFRYLCGTSDSK